MAYVIGGRRWKALALVALAAALALAGLAALSALPARASHPSAPMQQGTEVEGSIVTDTVWTPAGNPYHAIRSVTVNEGVSLTIESGVVVEFGETSTLRVRGSLMVRGSAPGDVVFTSDKPEKARGDWPTVEINSEDGGADIRGLTIRYAGRNNRSALRFLEGTMQVDGVHIEDTDAGGIYIDGKSTALRNVTVVNSAAEGIRVDQSGSDEPQTRVELVNVTLQGNDEEAVVSDADVQLVLQNTTAQDNGINGIYISGGEAKNSVTWMGGDLPYVINSTVTAGNLMTLESGTVVKFTGSGAIRVRGGGLAVNGSDGAKVYFTTLADDEACTTDEARITCDTNNDDSATVPDRGDWDKLRFESTTTGVTMTHAIVRYGSGPVMRVETEGVSIRDTEVFRIEGDGVLVDEVSTTIERTEIRDVEARALIIDTSETNPTDITLTDNRFCESGVAVAVLNPNVDLMISGNSTRCEGDQGEAEFTNDVNGYLINGDLTTPQTWRAGDMPFVIDSRVELAETAAVLTLEPGLTVKLRPDAMLISERGQLRSGEAGETRVLFTSLLDDACSADVDDGCDTNGDGDRDQPGPGDWGAISIRRGSAGAFLRDTVVRYGGDDTLSRAQLDLQSANSTVESCEFSFSKEDGIRVYQTPTLTLTGNNIHHNERHGLALVAGTVPIVVTLEGEHEIKYNKGHAIDADANVEIVLNGPVDVVDNGRNGVVLHGDSRVSRTWREGDLAYIIADDVDVIGQSTLTIEPGVIIKLENDAVLNARDGRLIAVGGDADDERIIFTSVSDDEHGGNANPGDGDVFPKAGDWGGIAFDASGRGGELRNADVLYSGGRGTPAVRVDHPETIVDGNLIQDGGDNGVEVTDVNVEITDNVITRLRGTGIDLASDDKPIEPTVTGNEISDCAIAITMDANVEPVLGGNSAEDNNLNGILVSGSVDVSRNWPKGDLLYILSDTVNVNQGATLRIEAGTVLKAQLEGFLVVKRGALEIPRKDSGTARVTFTSVRDDTCGAETEGTCDTNNDGDNTEPRPGDWRGFKIESGARAATIDNILIDYAGGFEAAIVIEKDLATLEHSTISRSGTDGVLIEDVLATIRNNHFDLNVGNGLKLLRDAGVTVEGNIFTRNGRPVEHRAEGNTVTNNNVAIGNANDAMLYCADVKTAQTWPSDLTREVDCVITVEDGLLDIDPGAVLLFNSRTGIKVESELHAEGVTFSSAAAEANPGDWNNVLFTENSRGGYVRHSRLMFGGATDNMIEAQSSGAVQVLFNVFRRAEENAIEAGSAVDIQILGNVIRDVSGDRGSGILVTDDGTDPEISTNRIANAANGIIANNEAQPTIKYNSFEGTGRGVENKEDDRVCVEAQQNWWGHVTGPNDDSEREDVCRLKDNLGEGVAVSDGVNYLNWWRDPPPMVPLVEGPRCGYTNNDRPEAFGFTSPRATVNVYDSNSATPAQPIASEESGDDGGFKIDLNLSAGEHRLSFQAVRDGRSSPVSGFRIIHVEETEVDPAGIRFEYGDSSDLRVQPLRDVSGCATACGGPTSGRVTLPPETDVRVHVPIDGSPGRVEFVQEGQPAVALSYNGATDTYMSAPFRPIAGPFQIAVDGEDGDQCLGYVYLGRESVVFFDFGAEGPPPEDPNGLPFDYDFESGTMGWTPGQPWARIDDVNNAKSPTHAWHDSPDGNYAPNVDVELRSPGPIDLRTVVAPELSFWHKYNVANDQATVEISTNGGDSWREVKRYRGDVDMTVFTGEVISLEEYQREPRVWFRFRLKTNSSQEADGWYIDDVAVRPGGALNGRYDLGEPLVPEAEMKLEHHNVDTGEWLIWRGEPTGQLNPQTSNSRGSYGFYYLEPGEYRVTATLEGRGVHRSPPLIVWNGVLEYDAPMTGGLPNFLPVVIKNRSLD